MVTRSSPRHCPHCGALGILPLDQPHDERGRIVDPVMECPRCETEFRATRATWLGALQFPDDWDELSEDEKMAVALGMARQLQRQWGSDPRRTSDHQYWG